MPLQKLVKPATTQTNPHPTLVMAKDGGVTIGVLFWEGII